MEPEPVGLPAVLCVSRLAGQFWCLGICRRVWRIVGDWQRHGRCFLRELGGVFWFLGLFFVDKNGSVQESVNTCVFAGFLSVGWRGHPRHRILSTRVLGNVFKPFVILFMPSLVAISCYANALKGWPRGSPGTRQLPPPNRSLFVARDRGSLQILGLELASEDIPHRIRASGLPPGAFAVFHE
jgi:hypothetical protein